MNDFGTVKDKGAQFRIGYLCVTIALTIAVCALGCISVVSSCESDARYFSASTAVTVFAIAIALSIALSFAALFIFKKEPIKSADMSDGYARAARYSSVLPAFVSLGVALFSLFNEGLEQWSNAVMIFGALSALFFTLKLFTRLVTLKAVSGFGVFLLGAVIIASLYLDMTIELNSHFKLLVQFGAAGMILGTIADLRTLLSPSSPKKAKTSNDIGEAENSAKDGEEVIKITARGFIFLKLLASTLCAVCSSVIILYFAVGNSALGTHYLVYSVLYLAYAISVVFELIGAIISVINGHI